MPSTPPRPPHTRVKRGGGGKPPHDILLLKNPPPVHRRCGSGALVLFGGGTASQLRSVFFSFLETSHVGNYRSSLMSGLRKGKGGDTSRVQRIVVGCRGLQWVVGCQRWSCRTTAGWNGVWVVRGPFSGL